MLYGKRMADITELPIYKHQAEINDALEKHQVIVVEGPTGCGKTTQLPRILLRNPKLTGRIALTQPRRIAAVSVAMRIAKEIGVELGEEVGYAIRFDDKTSENTLVKVMTDGILLQESRSDHLYSNYKVIIIDEAHERSLNIDLALGLLRLALDKRADLRVIISSATIKAEQFQNFFASPSRPQVPLISIKSRTYPVEFRYKAVPRGERRAMPETLVSEVKRIHQSGGEGHILAFLPGQAAIMDCVKLLEQSARTDSRFRDLWIMPLYGQLPREEQEKVFEQRSGYRKVVLATNIAETSITIPDVRFVIDSGIAKIPRFNNMTNIMTLKEEPISKASMAQRAGRAGRTAPGLAIRLYAEESLDKRPDFTDEEITRLDLSEVLLRLIDLGIHDVENFPLPTKPPLRAINDALHALRKMDAIDERNYLTPIGEKMTPYPLLPKLARAVVEAGLRFPNVLEEVIFASAYLSVKSPFMFPPGKEIQARRAHARLASAKGDLITAIQSIRKYIQSEEREVFCRKFYLDPDIMAFILKSAQQLMEISESMGFQAGTCEDENDVIRVFLVSYGAQYLQRKANTYLSSTGEYISLHPSSALFDIKPRLIMAIEFVQSTRTYAQQASTLRSSWLKERGISLDSQEQRREQRFDARNKKQRRLERLAAKLAPQYEQREDKARSVPAKSISLCGETFSCVSTAKGLPQALIPLSAAHRLRNCKLEDIPKDMRKMRASLRDDSLKYAIIRNNSLHNVISLIQNLPLPSAKPEDSGSIPLGASLEAPRNATTIFKHLPRLLSCIVAPQRLNPGWLTLAAADEVFWFELNHDPIEALSISIQALSGLADYCDEPKHMRQIEVQLERLTKLDSKIRRALR
jgi:ATP-dependent helicase HrpA